MVVQRGFWGGGKGGEGALASGSPNHHSTLLFNSAVFAFLPMSFLCLFFCLRTFCLQIAAQHSTR